jgi:hypothetical protein
MSFFQDEKTFFGATYAMDATCNVAASQCLSLMNSLAAQLPTSDVCGPDLQLQNPLVEQTYNGLLSYGTLYQAGCLKDDSGNYCMRHLFRHDSIFDS